MVGKAEKLGGRVGGATGAGRAIRRANESDDGIAGGHVFGAFPCPVLFPAFWVYCENHPIEGEVY